MLTLRDLQNTHAALHARTARYSDFPSMKTAENVDENTKSDLSSMKTAENVDGRTGVTTVYEEMPVFIKLLIVKKFNL